MTTAVWNRILRLGVTAIITATVPVSAAVAQAPAPLSDAAIVGRYYAPDVNTPWGTAQGTWPWGEQFFEQNASTTLELDNSCDTAQTVIVSVHSSIAAMVDIPRSVLVPPRTTLSVPVTIIGPPLPQLPPIPAPNGGPLDIKLDMATVRPAIVTLQGSGGPPGSGARCERGMHQALHVTGHFHVDPTAVPRYRGPSMTHCDVWWYTGREPSTNREDCAERFAQLLDDFRDSTLVGLVADDPEAWAWLPTFAELLDMSEEQILAVQRRAQAQIASGAGETS